MPFLVLSVWLLLTGLVPAEAQAFASPHAFENESSDLKALVFLSSYCPCSKSHVGHLNELSQAFPGVKIFGVITDDMSGGSKKMVEGYYSQKRFRFPIIADPKQKLVKEYKALKTPHVVLAKKAPNGKFTKIYEGGLTDKREYSKAGRKFLEENLMALKDNKELPHSQGRSLGCYIRRL